MLFFKYSANRYGLGLSNEPLFIIIAQGAAKLRHVKVGGPRILPYACSYLVKRGLNGSGVESFLTSNFDRSQFCSPLSYDDEKWFI